MSDRLALVGVKTGTRYDEASAMRDSSRIHAFGQVRSWSKPVHRTTCMADLAQADP